MWRVFHTLFGWHYVEYRNSYTHFIARVATMPNGRKRMVTLSGTHDALMNPDGTFDGTSGVWRPLTWVQEK